MLDPSRLHPERIRPLTRDEFEQLVAMGAFQDERVELLRGALVTMSAQEEPHARISAWLHAALLDALDRDRYEIRSHTSYAATWDSVPEPDVQVLALARRRRLPRRALLGVEVTDSSMYRDRTIKQPIYAENRAPEYWIVDVPSEQVHVFTRPTRSGYAAVETRTRCDVLHPIKLPGLAIPVAAIPWTPGRQPRPRRRPRRR